MSARFTTCWGLVALAAFAAVSCKVQTARLASTGEFGDDVTVDVAAITRPMPVKPFGINLNYLRDSDANRPSARPIVQALKDLGTHYYRYPGGEKSDFHLWSVPPYSSPNPQVLGWYQSQSQQLLDFDQFMTYLKQVQGEPYIVVGYDSQARTGKSKQEYLDSAVAWVRYANTVKKYGIKYWEIGNENWNNSTGSAAEVGGVVSEFSQAMKAVDPSIQIGASTNHDFSPDLLKTAGKDLDFLVISNYPGLKSYDSYASDDDVKLQDIAKTAADIDQYAAPADAKRLAIVVTEFNTLDWSHTWANTNDTGHALANFDIFGQLLSQPRLAFAMFWNTRWMEGKDNLNNALADDNTLTPQGQAIAIWGQFLLEAMVSSTSAKSVPTYATYSTSQNRAVVFLVNKSTSSRTVNLSFKNLTPLPTAGDCWQFSGSSATDASPTYGKCSPVSLSSGAAKLTLLPLSITAIDTGAAAGQTASSGSGTSSQGQAYPQTAVQTAPAANPQKSYGSNPKHVYSPALTPYGEKVSLNLGVSFTAPSAALETPPPRTCASSGCNESCSYAHGDVWQDAASHTCFRWCPAGAVSEGKLSGWGWIPEDAKKCIFRGFPAASLRLH